MRSAPTCALALLLAACGPPPGPGGPAGPGAKSDVDGPPSASQVLADHAGLQLVVDTPQQEITRVLLFGGTDTIVPLHVALIGALPAAEFFVVPSERQRITAQTYRDALAAAGVSAANVQLYEGFGYPLTDWTQDRVMRFQLQDRAVLLPVMSGSLALNERAPFELGVPRRLEQRYPQSFAPLPVARYYAEKVVDGATGEVYGFSSAYASWYRASVWRLGYGDGGDRVATESTLFVRGPTHAQMLARLRAEVPLLDGGLTSHEELLGRLFGKQVVRVGDADELKQYVFHLDMFLTAFDLPGGGTRVLLGSPVVGLQAAFGVSTPAGLPPWVEQNSWSWNKRLNAFTGIKADLLAQGFEVVELPILFLDLSDGQTAAKRIVTFNNGLLTRREGQPAFLSVSYAFGQPELDAALARAQAEAQRRIQAAGLQVEFLPGGESSAPNGGELRCTAGVIGQRP